MTPEGELLAAELARPDDARIRVAGQRRCTCGRPDCPQKIDAVLLTIDDTTAMAMSPEAVRSILLALQQASTFVWPEADQP